MEKLILGIVFLSVWILIIGCFVVAGLMAEKQEQEKCKNCKYRYPCSYSGKKICVKK